MSDEDAPDRSDFRLPGPDRVGASIHLSWGRTKIKALKVTRLKFKTDHRLMTDNNTDWKNSGSVFSKPEWTYGVASKPISHTKDQKVQVEVDFEVYPPDAEETDATVTGTAKFGSLVFTGPQKFKGGTVTFSAESSAPLPDAVQKLTGDINWSVSTTKDGPFDAGASWGHTIYVTMDKPVNPGGLEDGITQFRMEKAVALVQATGTAKPPWSDVPHALVLALMQTIPGYRIIPDPAVNSARPGVNHPNFMNNFGGAWNIADFISNSAECQAIVRFVRAIIKQIGCGGLAQVMLVYVDPTVNNGNDVLEDDFEHPTQFDNGDKNKPLLGLWHTPFQKVNGRLSEALLLGHGSSLKIGTVFDRNKKGRLPGISPNFYEACLKFTFPESGPNVSTKYYPGGVGGQVFDTKELVIPTFLALVWMSEPGGGQPGEELLKLEKVVRQWP